jgi:hypothetical protein
MRDDLNRTGIMRDGPEAHGLEVCRHCNGYGSCLKEESDPPCGSGLGQSPKVHRPSPNLTG